MVVISVVESFTTLKRTVRFSHLMKVTYTSSMLTGYGRTCYMYLNLGYLRHLGNGVNLSKKKNHQGVI